MCISKNAFICSSTFIYHFTPKLSCSNVYLLCRALYKHHASYLLTNMYTIAIVFAFLGTTSPPDFNDYQINMALMGINAATNEQAAVKAATAVYHPTMDMADAVKQALETKIRQFRVPPGWTQPIPPPLPFGFDVMNLVMSAYYAQQNGGTPPTGTGAAVPSAPAPAPPPAPRRRPQRRRPTQIRRGPTAPQPTAPQSPPPQPPAGNVGRFNYPPNQNAWQQPLQSQWPSQQNQWRQPPQPQWQQPQQSQWRQPQQWQPPQPSRWQPSPPQPQQRPWQAPPPPPRQPQPTPQYTQPTTGQSQFINGWEQNYFGATQTQQPASAPAPSPSSVPDFTPLASSMPGWINPFYNPSSNPSAWK